jgi:hypothetical protein
MPQYDPNNELFTSAIFHFHQKKAIKKEVKSSLVENIFFPIKYFLIYFLLIILYNISTTKNQIKKKEES